MNRLKALTARRPEWASRTLINAGFFGALLFARYQTGPGTLELTIVDDLSGRPTPARVELLDADRKAYIAGDALPVNGDCADPQVPLDLTPERAIAMLSKTVENPYRQTTQFYSVGSSIVSS